MSDDLWLKELAQVIRDREAEERSRLDERWDRLSAGTLSPEEEAELKALAETSEEARDAYEAFRPLGPEFQASVVREIRKKQPLPRQDEPTAAESPPKLLWFRRRDSFRWAGWGAAAAVAASLLFLIGYDLASYPPLPVYTAEVGRGDQESRGETGPAAGLPVFSPGSLFSLSVLPRQAVMDPVEVHGFLADGGDLVPWEPAPPFEVVEGKVRLRGSLGREIRLPEGTWTVWIVVSRPGKGPSARELQAELRDGRRQDADWQAVCASVKAMPLQHSQWQTACASLRMEDQPPP